jgi:hypothetical protein
MEWTHEAIEKGFELYVALSKRGYLTPKEGEYLSWYDEREVQEYIRKIVEPKGKVMVFLDEETGTLQMVPEVDNETMSFTNEDLKRELRFHDNKEIHLFYFILFLIIAELTQMQDRELVKRLYMPMEELLEKMNGYIEQYESLGEDKLVKLSDEYEVDVVGIVDAWIRMAEFKEGALDHSRTKGNHRAYIEKSLKFLEKQKLVRVRGKQDISVTNKMENIINYYYHNVTNKNKIHDLLHQTKEGFDWEGEV